MRSKFGGESLVTKRSIGQFALLVFALATPAQTWAQADTSKQMEQADAANFPQGRLLDTFGKWQIREGLIANTYLLIGKSVRNDESQITVAVPMEVSGSDRLRCTKSLYAQIPGKSVKESRCLRKFRGRGGRLRRVG